MRLGNVNSSTLRLAVVITSVVGGSANAQSVDPVETYLSSFSQKVTDAINNAGAQGRGVTMEAGQSVLNAIGAFRSAYADALGKSESALTAQQEELFQKIRSSTIALNNGIGTSTESMQRITDTLAGAISNFPGSKDLPRITRIGPLYTVGNAGVAEEIVIKGLGLSNGDPTLEFSGKAISPNTKTDSELRFSLPGQFVAQGKPLIVQLTLRLFEIKSRFLGLYHYSVPHAYPVRIAVYPREIGQLAVTARRVVDQIDVHDVPATNEYRCASPHGDGSLAVPVSLVPSSGAEMSNLRFVPTYSNHGSFTMNTTSSAGSTATLSCYGWGKIEHFGVVVDAGNVGVEKGYFVWTETRHLRVQQNDPGKISTLRWGDTVAISDLPPDTQTVLLELKPFTGQTLDLEGSGANRFVKLEFNGSSKVAIITANDIEHALRE